MTKEIIPIFEDFNQVDYAVYGSTYMFLKAIAIDNDFQQTLIALAVARKMHEGQYRKDGVPYIMHPLKVCSTLYDYGIKNDTIFAASLLHDVLEDCQDKLPSGGKELISEYGVDIEVYHIISLLTKESGMNDYELSIHFNEIKKDPRAALIKLADRLHNSQTLFTFSHDKLKKYIRETNMFLLPMARYGENYYSTYTNTFTMLKNNIYSLNHSMEIITNIYDEQVEELNRTIAEKETKIAELEAQPA